MKHATADGYLQLTDSTELTIASGAVTATANFYRVDTESNASTDDLDTITAGTGVADGHILILRAENAARTIIITHNTGNIMCRNGQNIVLDDSEDWALLIYDGNLTKWLAMVGPQSLIYRRQGGSSTDWPTSGTNNYSPLAPRIQAGVAETAGTVTTDSFTSVTVTFPAAFTNKPLVVAMATNSNRHVCSVDRTSVTNTDFSLTFRSIGNSGVIGVANWIAIGE